MLGGKRRGSVGGRVARGKAVMRHVAGRFPAERGPQVRPQRRTRSLRSPALSSDVRMYVLSEVRM